MTSDAPEARSCASFAIEGMSCASCAARIERVLARESGVATATVNYAAGTLSLEWDPRHFDAARAKARIEALGYRAHERGGDNTEEELVGLRIRLALSAFFCMNAMLPSLVLYVGAVDASDARARWWLAFATGVLTLPTLAFGGAPFLAGAVRSLRQHAPGMDLLVSLGAVATFAYSAVVLSLGSSDVYFDTSGMIVTFLLLGRLIERSARKRGIDSVHSLLSLSPPLAHRIDDGGLETDVDARTVEPGARIRIRPGERVPLDGRVETGESYVDRSLLTGEARPLRVASGDLVEAGTLNHDGVLLLEVTNAVGSRALDRIAGAVDRLLARRAPMQALADRFAAKLTVVVLVTAALTALVNRALTGSTSIALLRAVAVLVVACPCALGLATPMALLVAAGRAARRGILFRDGDAIERAARIDSIVFDKTGTLTTGAPIVTDLLPAPGVTRDELVASAALAEQGSEHPFARAIRASTEAPLVLAGAARTFPGKGVEWRGTDGTLIRVGAFLFVRELASAAAPDLHAPHTIPASKSAVHVASAGRWLGTILVADAVRADAAGAASALHRRGIACAIASGDREEVVADVAHRLGITAARGAVDPEEKAAMLEVSRREGRVVAFIGDGLNDGPAIAAADCGIAAHGATDVALGAAHVVIRAEGISHVVEALDLARKTRRVMKQNLGWALGYNVIAIALASAGLVTPVMAAAAMATSSITVVLNSLRLGRT
ncbi:Lead, cadmium, zinc and mercury transporting ATPase [Labilithrix luteola]|uniref:Lead, cadmium, zinc and mercury transporting ATPase n=1 Tax=Labilithrix luteola TaxID=1391654 RepID=A0A0K1PYG2_9BACT|nr:cation-translocating P-type ATPase [Labilithrix luteola]AKU98542.1 Lead, cadmium, zinc and mercury transporting ATPase [Labilithrix luteola]